MPARRAARLPDEPLSVMTTCPILRRALAIALASLAALAGAQTIEVDRARQISAAATALQRSDAGKLFADGFTLLQKGEYLGASDAYKRGLETDPGNVAARYYFGRALDGLGNATAARSQYELAAQLGPATPEGEIAKNVLADIDEDRQAKVDPCW